jgi:GTP cyclohydrolase I
MTEPIYLQTKLTAEERAAEMERLFQRFLELVEPDAGRQGLAETPKRMAKAWAEWTAGYAQDPAEVLKTFDDGAEKVDEMVLVRDIPVYSHCEHHLAPIIGVAHVAYIPNGKIVGLSKLARLVEVYARRLQVQERLTNQIADALSDSLSPLGVGVILKCRHMCMESRGIRTPGALTITSALRGCMKDEPDCRAEFLDLCR